MMMKPWPLMASVAVVCLSIGVSIAAARGPNKQGGPQRGGPMDNLQAGGAANGNAQRGGMRGNQMQQQNMPTIEQLAQAMLTQYDADGNSALDQAELQSALAGLRQMMLQNQAGGNCPPQMEGDIQQNEDGMQGRRRGAGGADRGRRGGQGGQAGRGGR